MLREIFSSAFNKFLAVIFAAIMVLSATSATESVLAASAAYDLVETATATSAVTNPYDINHDGILNIYDLILLKKSLLNDESSFWSVSDVIRLQRYLLETVTICDVSTIDVRPETVALFEGLTNSSFSYTMGLDGSVRLKLGGYLFEFDSDRVLYDSNDFASANVILAIDCTEKYEILNVAAEGDEFVLFVESNLPGDAVYYYLGESTVDDFIKTLRALNQSDFSRHVKTTADGSVMLVYQKKYWFVFDATKNQVAYERPDGALVSEVYTPEGRVEIFESGDSLVAYINN